MHEKVVYDYYIKKHNLELRTGTSRLNRTRRFALTDSGDALPTALTNTRTRTWTIGVTINTQTSDASGTIFEMGDDTTDLGLALDSLGGLEFVVGDADSVTFPGLFGGAIQRRVAIAINGGKKEARVYVNGRETHRMTYTGPTWAASDELYLKLIGGDSRLTNSENLTNATIPGLDLYFGQLPRMFEGG